MKNSIVIFFIFTFLSFVACHKGGGTPAPTPPPPNLDSLDAMTATFSNSNWAADSLSGFLIPFGNDSGRYNLSISGKKVGNSSVMILYISNYQGIGQYNISPPAVSATYYYQGSVRHYAVSGQIIITNDSTSHLQGNFSFVTDSTNGMSVTNGIFSFSL